MPSSARLNQVVRSLKFFLILLTIPVSAQDTVTQGFFTTSDQVKLHYIEAGQGKAILLIPGWLMPAEIWDAQIRELSKDYHVIALDPRSQGQSDMTKLGNDPLRRSQDIHELLDHLQLNSVALVGWSLGAFDCLAYLRQFGADNLNALVLVDSPLAAPPGPKPSSRGTFLKLFESDRVNADKDYVWGLFKQTPPKGFSKKMIAASDLIPTDIALAALDNTQPGDGWVPGIPAIRQVPILYAITPKYVSQAAYLQQVDAQARVETFETAGHALFVDEPERFNNLIKDFLRQASTYPAGLPHGTVKALVAAPSSAPTEIPVNVFTPGPEPTLTPTPVVVILTPTFTATMASTATPTSTFTSVIISSPTSLPSPVVTFIPLRIPKILILATPTEEPSLSSRLSKTWDSLWNGQASPTEQATEIPKTRPRRIAADDVGGNPVESNFFTTSDHVKLHYLEAGRGLALVFTRVGSCPLKSGRPNWRGFRKITM